MATKRVRKRLEVPVRLADGSTEKRLFKSMAAARLWAESQHAEITGDPKSRQVTVWRGRYTDLDGRRREKIFGAYNDAVAWEREMRAAVSHGIDPESGKVSLRSWHETWARTRATLSPSSRSRDAWAWGYLEPEFGGRALSAIKRSDVKGFAVSLMGGGMAREAALRVVGILALMLDDAMDDQLISRNPARDLNLPRSTRLVSSDRKAKSHEFLSDDQIRAIADEVPKRFRAVVLVGAWAGLRIEEISGLRRSKVHIDVEVGSPRIQIDEVLVEVGGRLYRQKPKTDASLADVLIDPEMVAVLNDHLNSGFAQPGLDGLMFTAARGGALRRNNFAKRILGPAAEQAIGKWISPHDLRRSYGSMLLAAGVPLVRVSKMMRHEKVETTLRHYTGLVDGSEDEAVERFYLWRSRIENEANDESGEAHGGLRAVE